jgi:hypothetical protein
MTTIAATASATEDETQRALGYLATSAYGVTEAVHELGPAQWSWKPAPDRWSIAEILEHLALLESLFVERIAPSLRASATQPPERDVAAADARLIALATDRSVSVVSPGRPLLSQAPSPITPRGSLRPEESMARFRERREEVGEFLRTAPPELRGRRYEHPALGPLDGHQWVLFLAAHSVRHTKQILEVKSDPGFPK